MDYSALILITLGVIFLLGLFTDALGKLTKLPRVTLLLLLGVIIGPGMLDLLPALEAEWFDVVTILALVMVGFLLGGELTRRHLHQHGRDVLLLSFSVVLATALTVFTALWIAGAPLEVALLLAGIAPATDPAASSDVVKEIKARGDFTQTLKGIVAVDDGWGLIAFSCMLALTSTLNGDFSPLHSLQEGGWELGGAALLGATLGIPMALLSGRVRFGEPTLLEALGIVLLCGGIALWLEVSYLFAAMVLGVVVANLAKHHTRPFRAIENIEWPFMVLFFVLAGATLEFGSLNKIGLLGGVYILSRFLGRFIGAYAIGWKTQLPPSHQGWMALALTPQAGVALGMALLTSQRFPEYQTTILPIVIGSTVILEIIGPVMTRVALVQTGQR